MRNFIPAIIIAALLTGALQVQAYEPSEWKKQETTYFEKAGQKFGFGFKNVLLGWTEFFNEPFASMHAKESIAVGFGKGLWHTVADTVGGAVHLVTFWLPALDLPLPHGGVKSGCTACSMKTS